MTPVATGDGPRRAPPHPDPLRALLAGSVTDAAMALLGARLTVRRPDGSVVAGTIAETEAYGGPEDRASHARAGRTARNAAMFGPPGRAYVYLIYGIHHCLNVVTGPDGEASAVLVRALRLDDAPPRAAAGPGLACRVLGVTRAHDGADLRLGDPLRLELGDPIAPEHVVCGPRIGVEHAGREWARMPWRFGLRGSPALSRPFPAG